MGHIPPSGGAPDVTVAGPQRVAPTGMTAPAVPAVPADITSGSGPGLAVDTCGLSPFRRQPLMPAVGFRRPRLPGHTPLGHRCVLTV